MRNRDNNNSKSTGRNRRSDKPFTPKDRRTEKPERKNRFRNDDEDNKPQRNHTQKRRGKDFEDKETPSRLKKSKRFEDKETPARFRKSNRSEDRETPSRYRKSNRFEDKENKRPFTNDKTDSRQKEYGNKRFDNKKETTRPKTTNYVQPGILRLNRYISNSGVCSRRDADELIAKGLITVNGETATEMGMQVKKNDDIRYQGKKLNPEAKVYILINKPKDMVTTASDPEGRRTVLNLIEGACKERVFPVGRLDRNTTGVLLLTNDGDLSKKLTHPSSESKKVYHVFTDKPVTKAHLEAIANGISLDDGSIKPDMVSYAHAEDKSQVGIEIHSGKNRIVRRIFEHFGYKVVKLDRVYFCGLTKKNLPRGKWRFLTEQEVKYLNAGLLK